MRYTQLTNPQVGEMLTAVGVRTVEELFSRVPEEIRLRRPLGLLLAEPGATDRNTHLVGFVEMTARFPLRGKQSCALGISENSGLRKEQKAELQARGTENPSCEQKISHAEHPR